MLCTLRITGKNYNSFTIPTKDIKIFDPLNRSQILIIDNKHDFLKVMKRVRKFKNSEVMQCKKLNRSERLQIYKSMYKGYSIAELQNIGLTI